MKFLGFVMYGTGHTAVQRFKTRKEATAWVGKQENVQVGYVALILAERVQRWSFPDLEDYDPENRDDE